MNALIKRRQAIIDKPEANRRAVGSFGDTGIPVALCRKAGKKYSQPSGDKIRTMSGRGGANLASFENTGTVTRKNRTRQFWLNDPRLVIWG